MGGSSGRCVDGVGSRRGGQQGGSGGRKGRGRSSSALLNQWCWGKSWEGPWRATLTPAVGRQGPQGEEGRRETCASLLLAAAQGQHAPLVCTGRVPASQLAATNPTLAATGPLPLLLLPCRRRRLRQCDGRSLSGISRLILRHGWGAWVDPGLWLAHKFHQRLMRLRIPPDCATLASICCAAARDLSRVCRCR